MANKAKKGEALCPHCKQPSSVKAVHCPHCGITFTQAEIDVRGQADNYASAVSKDDKTAGLIGCAAVIIAILLLATCVGGDDKIEGDAAKTAASRTGDPKLDVIALYDSVKSTVAPCDAAASRMADAMQRGDIVPAYRAANQAEDACLGTSSEIRKLDVPGSVTGEHRKTLEEALEACDTAYVMKWSGARKVKNIVNGDAKPSDVVELEDTTKLFQSGQMLCVGGIVAAATALGATATELGIEEAKK
jgi:hypothetical protein